MANHIQERSADKQPVDFLVIDRLIFFTRLHNVLYYNANIYSPGGQFLYYQGHNILICLHMEFDLGSIANPASINPDLSNPRYGRSGIIPRMIPVDNHNNSSHNELTIWGGDKVAAVCRHFWYPFSSVKIVVFHFAHLGDRTSALNIDPSMDK